MLLYSELLIHQWPIAMVFVSLPPVCLPLGLSFQSQRNPHICLRWHQWTPALQCLKNGM